MKLISIKYILGLFLICGLFACEKEYETPPYDNFEDAAARASGNTRIQRGDFTSFIDISKGIVTRTWTIPEGAFIMNANGKTDEELDLVHVQFDEPGVFEVGLTTTFSNPDLLLDTIFNVTVLDYIQAEVDVVNVDAGFFEETPTQITMYEGGTITFADSSAGSPNRRIWIFEGAEPNRVGGVSIDEDSKYRSIDVNYPSIGVYDVQLISWRSSPTGDPDTVLLKDFVNVVENIDPPSVLSVEEDNSGVIHLQFNLDMKVSGDLAPHFTLMVDGVPMGIMDVSLNTADRRVLDIVPETNIDKYAEVSLSYDGNGPLSRTNDIAAEAFSDVAVSTYFPPNVLAEAGIESTFESGTIAGWNPELIPANGNAETVNDGVKIEWSADGYESNGSLVMLINPNNSLDGVNQKNNFRFETDITNYPMQFEAGMTYVVEYYYKIEGNGLNQCTWRMHGEGWDPAPGGGWMPGAATEWTLRRNVFTAANPTDLPMGKISLQGISKTNNESAKVYFDNIKVFALEKE